MKNIINNLRSDKVTFWGFSISVCCIVLTILIAGLYFRFLPPLIPLYNGMPWGYARLANSILFFIPVGIATLFFITNYLFSGIIYKQTALLSRLLCAITVLLSIIAGIFTTQIIMLVH